MEIKQIATFHSPFKSKFGVPKQSGLANDVNGEIVFLPAFRNIDALRGIDGYDWLWLLWSFHANRHQAHSLVVRPPVLGGNERRGVFATRSPYRPNPIGLSSVRLQGVEWEGAEAPILYVAGADLMDGTPIVDIKPYLAYTDAHPDAKGGFSEQRGLCRLSVEFSPDVLARLSDQQIAILSEILSLDPRPRYHCDDTKVYGMPYGEWDVKFRVSQGRIIVVDL